ncbi:acetylglutamate kinase [Sediminibacillus massiliensis]|uniref:acetylglutamate kinase n=1 Tax=Sediminibacillus massiliensis TaxID=1926277 RepID=UPI00098881B7|nr:acetylglutamate kinase [Sediminibacillus massiliensis]
MNYLVIKCGGSVFEALPFSFFEDIVNLQKNSPYQPVIVHGGGPLINSLLERLEVESPFVDGLRVTNSEVLDVVEMALSGSLNKQIVRKLHKAGGNGFGLSGIDGQLLTAVPAGENHSLGFVGKVSEVNSVIVDQIAGLGYIPVISPLGIDEQGQTYNINADMAAASIAQALKAKLCFISDIPGILVEEHGEQTTLHQATAEKIEGLIEAGIIKGGMIPKVRSAIEALGHGVPEVSIINGMAPDSLTEFTNGEKIGTKITLD